MFDDLWGREGLSTEVHSTCFDFGGIVLRISTNYLDTLAFVKGVRGEYLETNVSPIRNGEKQLRDLKACKGHSGKLSLLQCFIGDTGLVGTLFPFDC